MNMENVPLALREFQSWVLWKALERDGKATKVPFRVSGLPAKSNDSTTWATFGAVCDAFADGGYDGIGFEFSKEDQFCGIDLDGCRDPESGRVADWAREIVLAIGTYAEVSPTKTGVKLFVVGKSPFATGKKKELPDMEKISVKTPAIEIYDWGRYFAVTGMRLRGPAEPKERQEALNELAAKYFANEPMQAKPVDFRSGEAVVERARKYIAKIPPAISGQDGHGRTFHAACVLVLGFELPESDAMTLMHVYNQSCQPQWSEKELLHKVRCAAKQTGTRGYLRNASPDNWSAVRVPIYQEPIRKHEARETTLWDATCAYMDQLKSGVSSLITTGIGDLDYALGGGLELGEMVILAARPSHGKSAVGLQCIHHWTLEGRPCAIISEEMAALALGKRTVQFISDIPQEHWHDLMPNLENQVIAYGESHAKCIVLEGCGTAEVAREAIERVVAEHKVQCVVVDYAQLLGAPGKDRYHQMTTMSVTLRQLASSQKIVLVALCQMSRDIDKRRSFAPELSDIKETGQLEQDADIISFLCWPHRLDHHEPANKFQFFIKKNRNRPINQPVITCRFVPGRQQILDSLPEMSGERIPDTTGQWD